MPGARSGPDLPNPQAPLSALSWETGFHCLRQGRNPPWPGDMDNEMLWVPADSTWRMRRPAKVLGIQPGSPPYPVQTAPEPNLSRNESKGAPMKLVTTVLPGFLFPDNLKLHNLWLTFMASFVLLQLDSCPDGQACLWVLHARGRSSTRRCWIFPTNILILLKHFWGEKSTFLYDLLGRECRILNILKTLRATGR